MVRSGGDAKFQAIPNGLYEVLRLGNSCSRSLTFIHVVLCGRTPIITYYRRKHRRLNKEEANGPTGRVYRGQLLGKGGKDNGL